MEQHKRMRQFHNDVKLKVLQENTQEVSTLLDIGTGRGGDMHKWDKCNIQHVVGIDISKAYIQEAIKRFNSSKHLKGRNYKFYYTAPDKMYDKYLQFIGHTLHFDIVTCMFAFHYFFENEKTLDTIMNQISNSLTTGGRFIGVAPFGENIVHMFKMTKGDIIQNNAFYIEKSFKNLNTETLGMKIKFMISGTLYFGERMLSEEYLVFKSVLQDVASQYNMKVIKYTSFHDYYNSFYNLQGDFFKASMLNGVFVLEKN